MIIELNELQSHAIRIIASKEHKFFALIGGGGTGKTTTISQLPKHWRVAYTAPTNKAVSVLASSDKIPTEHCFTIYSLLGLTVNESNGAVTVDKKGKCKAGNYDVIVIDEASMLNDDMVSRIESVAYSNFKLMVIFMGDSYQLPPVGQDKSAAFSMADCTIELIEQMRQSDNDHPMRPMLDDLRGAVDSGAVVDFEKYAKQSTNDNGEKIGVVVTRNARQFESWAKKTVNLENGVVVVAYKNSVVDRYNHIMHLHNYPDSKDRFSVGETVIVQSPVKLPAFCGSFPVSGMGGIVYRIGDELTVDSIEKSSETIKLGDESITFETLIINDERIRCLSHPAKFKNWWDARARMVHHEKTKYGWSQLYGIRDMFADVKLGYAITAHKSQGSTYNNVFVDVRDIMTMREDQKIINKCLYVALSRAKLNAVILL